MSTPSEPDLPATGLLYRLKALDVRAYRFFVYLGDQYPAYPVARFISRMGDGYLYAVVALIGWLVSEEQGEKLFITSIVAVTIEMPVYWFLKRTFKRARPFNQLDDVKPLHIPSDEFSFPSGHASAAYGVALMVAYFFPAATLAIYICATLIALSRVWLRLHFVSDIIGGFFFGSAMGALAIMIVGY